MWLETVILFEAVAVAWLSGMNLVLSGRVAVEARGRARRAAALVLASLCAAQAMEASLFLLAGFPALAAGGSLTPVVLVRSALFGSTALLTLLLVRARSLRR